MYFKVLTAILTFLFGIAWLTPNWAQENGKDTTMDQAYRLNIVPLGDDARVILAPVCANPLPGIWFVHLHEDESTAVQAALEFIDSLQQGCFVTMQHGMGRNISFSMSNLKYTFDPNRIFTDEGRKATLLRFGPYSDTAFAQITRLAKIFSAKFIDSNRLVVALHNNTNEGGLTIKAYQKGGAYAQDAAKVFVNKKQDIDDFFYTTSEKAFDFFRKKGFNVLLQNNETVTDDGSLSVYADLKHIDYVNIEVEHGRKGQQKQMLGAVMEYIQTYYSLPETNKP